MRSLRLAWKYIQYHRLKSAILVACITLTLFLPIALAVLIGEFNQQIVSRAKSTPFVIGAHGSKLDLALHALYYTNKPPGSVRYEETELAQKDGLSQAFPIHVKYTLRDYPIVGTTLDYFEFRNLQLQEGEWIARIGDCVVGHEVARRIGLKLGDRPMSDSENVLDFAGAYPLTLEVCGILAKTDSADDQAIFVDLKTAWVLEGKGHGHQNIDDVTDADLLNSSGSNKVASQAVQPYLEFTPENSVDFHFHGDKKDYPVTAIIVVPRDEKGATLLLGRAQRNDSQIQMVEPMTEVSQLMSLVFRVQKFFNANAMLLAGSTLMLLFLVVLLSLRLRKNEMETMFKIGCSRGTIASMQLAELFLIFVLAFLILSVLIFAVYHFAPELVQWLLSGR